MCETPFKTHSSLRSAANTSRTQNNSSRPSIYHTTATMSAAARVFAIAELHENILRQLPMRDLLLAQRVCSSWQDAITTSTLLQQLLFLKLVVASSSSPKREGTFEPMYGNWYSSSNMTFGSHVANPVLGLLKRHIRKTGCMWFDNINAMLEPPWSHQEASWRRMLICQPATTGTFEYVFDCLYRRSSMDIKPGEAFKASDTLDLIADRRIEQPRCPRRHAGCYGHIKLMYFDA